MERTLIDYNIAGALSPHCQLLLFEQRSRIRSLRSAPSRTHCQVQATRHERHAVSVDSDTDDSACLIDAVLL